MVAADDVSQVSEADTFGLPDAGWTTIERRLDDDRTRVARQTPADAVLGYF